MGKWGKWDREKWGICSKLSHFTPIFLQFPSSFAHVFYISHWVLLALLHICPFPPISPHFPHFPPFSRIFPIFLDLCG